MSPTYQRWSHILLITMLIVTSLGVGWQPTPVHAQQIFTVTTTDDTEDACDSSCSLREAINAANAYVSANPDTNVTIAFDIPGDTSNSAYDPTPGSQTWTITPGLPLPAVLSNITVDGSSQAENAGPGDPNEDGPEIIIDGQNITNIEGFSLQGTNSTIKGLAFVNFKGGRAGIRISGDDNKIQGNYIGINKSGDATSTSIVAGIWITSTGEGNIIGGVGSNESERNLISGNGQQGIIIDGDNNFIRGNFIGTDKRGFDPVPNQSYGIWIDQEAEGNVIGTNADSQNASFSNLISGNYGYGIYISDASNNEIYGNYIGTNQSGLAAIPNGTNPLVPGVPEGGIFIYAITSSATGNVIGGTTSYSRNFIAGNDGPGIRISGSGAGENIIVNNHIGLNRINEPPDGSLNQTVGILVDFGAKQNTIGGSGNAGNVIGGINGDGIRIEGLKTIYNRPSNDNIIIGNCIGITPQKPPQPQTVCEVAQSNAGNGITIKTNVSRTQIGGPTDEERNIIAYNGGDGITIQTNTSDVISTTLLKNTITENAGNGVSIANAQETIINGQDAETPLVVSDNGGNGIEFSGTVTTTIRYSSIAGNAVNGILFDNGSSTDIISNTIMENAYDGIRADRAISTTIQGNIINENGANSAGEGGNGIIFTGNSVPGLISGNTIYTNTLSAVVLDGTTKRTAILDNRMMGNGELITDTVRAGIELVGDTSGLTGQSVAAALAIPNHDIDPPFNMGLNQDGQLFGYVYTDTVAPGVPDAAACIDCTVQIFSTSFGTSVKDIQGQELLGAVTPASDGSFTFQLTEIPTNTTKFALTATDNWTEPDERNTSEFAAFTVTRSVQIEPPRVTTGAFPTQVITYTHTVTNNGTVNYNDLVLSYESSLGWGANAGEVVLEPSTPFALAAGERQPVTVTLTLPAGPDERVLAGLTDLLTVTVSSRSEPSVSDSVVDTTTLSADGKIVLSVTPLTSTGYTEEGKPIDYAHAITNNGNITATLELNSTAPPPDWQATLSETGYEVGPGETVQPVLTVTPPEVANAGATAVVNININVLEDATQNKTITDTTLVTTTAAVQLYPARQVADGAAGRTVTFEHVIENISRGPVNIQLVGSSSLGSEFRFLSTTPGLSLDSQNGVTLTENLPQNVINIVAEVTIPEEAAPGQSDTFTIQVLDARTGNIIASAQDRTDIVLSTTGSTRLWLPIIRR
jgi:CSLREA domain-containing protein